jgi:hypothetical protein
MIILIVLLFLVSFLVPANAHDIYTGVVGKNNQLCCGAKDCSVTSYRENRGNFDFLTRENHWVTIPIDRITFLPIPGDPPHEDTHAAHLCYGEVTGAEGVSANVFSGPGQSIYLYCAFIPPGGV